MQLIGDAPPEVMRTLLAAQKARSAARYSDAIRLLRNALYMLDKSVSPRTVLIVNYLIGDCYRFQTRDDEALAHLLPILSTKNTDYVDESLFVSTTTTVMYIAQRSLPLSTFRTLLSDCIERCQAWRNEAFRGGLLYNEAIVEEKRGEHEKAYLLLTEAWELHRSGRGYYTSDTILWSLCSICFRRANLADLTRWCDELDQLRATTPCDDCRASKGKLYLARARCDREAIWNTARRIHDKFDSTQCDRAEAKTVGRAFALCGRFSLAREAIEHEGAVHLTRGDITLMEARAVLGMAPRDDDWDTEYPLPEPPILHRDQALALLREAEDHYEAERAHAQREDTRLETAYNSDQLAERQRRVAALRAAVG